MANLKTAFITTVRNEEKTIIPFLESLFAQSVMPSEIIIVDGGSTDNTIDLISSFLPKKEKQYAIKLLFQKGNRSVGRNAAIKKAESPIILCSDAGCILDKDWVKNITKPFHNPSIHVVSGFYRPLVHSVFEKCLASYTCVMPDNVDSDNFLPSSRSIAFTKKAWEKAGGYPEWLDTCEDLVFDRNLQKTKASFVFAENAIVFWPQRKNLVSAVKQFFFYATGDGEAHFFRKQTPLLYLRYFVGISFFSLGSLFHNAVFSEALLVFVVLYLLWSIGKNYKYVNDARALFWLPVLQLSSDIAVMIGTALGFMKSLHLVNFFFENKIPTLSLILYVLIFLSSITFGIPNYAHPFSYHMDEWAQAQSIRTLFRHGTPNISGSSHGVMLQYFLAGVYLIPFILFHIVNPFVIKSSLEHIDMQQRLFIILRFNTLLYGIGSLLLLSFLGKKYFAISNKITSLLVVTTPVFLLLSEFFKYDIALLFWISLTVYASFIFAHTPSKRNFLLLTVVSALTLCIKLSAVPVIPLLFVSFFLFIKHPLKKLSLLAVSSVLFLITFCIAGIPDLLLGIGDYKEWLSANLTNPTFTTNNLTFKNSYVWFFFSSQYPALFGHALFFLFLISFLFVIIFHLQRKTLFLCIAVFLFAVSLFPLQIGANGNRLLVFLPFMILLVGIFLTNIQQRFPKVFYLLCFVLFALQIFESFTWLSVRYSKTPREEASLWIEQHIPQATTIGIENVPIFQGVPDIILKDFYASQYFPKKKSRYSYLVLDKRTDIFPKYVIISDLMPSLLYYKESDKRVIFRKLKKMGYRQRAVYSPNLQYYHILNTDKAFYFGAIIPTPFSITIFYK